MTIYIALLRGINVGGKNIIKMADLRSVLETMGLKEVQTYIQSGNVLFKSDQEEESLRLMIGQGIEAAFGFFVQVILRKAEDLEWIITNCPFSAEKIKEAEASSEGECLYVSLMMHAPTHEKIECLKTYKIDSDEYKVDGREVFLLFKNSIRNSKLVSNLHKLDVPATVRNWKTINKLYALARSMED